MSLPLKIQEAIASNILRLILLPTEQCCFRCDYCYENFELGKMTPALQQAIIKLVEKRAPQLDKLNISWFGGEPLMAKDIIYSLSAQLQAICQRKNIHYNAAITTNAYLLDVACYNKLVDYGVNHFQITLDGAQAQHDQVRKRVDGAATFDTIMTNLLAIKQQSTKQATILLRLHYRPDTYDSVLTLIDELKQTLLTDERFEVVLRAVGKWGGPNDDNLTTFNNNETHKQAVAEKLLQRLDNSESPYNTPANDHICYAAQANSLVIRADGRLAKCTVAFSHANNQVGHLKPDGTLQIQQDNFKKWLIGLSSGDKKQLRCPAMSVL